MGGAVTTLSGAAEDSLPFVVEGRAILRSEPSISNDVLKERLSAKYPERAASVSVDDLALLRTFHGDPKLADDAAVLQAPAHALRASAAAAVAAAALKSATVQARPAVAARAPVVAPPSDWPGRKLPHIFVDASGLVAHMGCEFKRGHLQKSTLYPPATDNAPRPLPPSVLGAFSCHGQSSPSMPKENQDRCLVSAPFGRFADARCALCIVADGHGESGHNVADFVAKRLFGEVARSIATRDAPNVRSALSAAFLATHAALKAAPEINSETSGTTCVLALVSPASVWTAHVGDSRVTIGRCVGPGPPNSKMPLVYKAHDLTHDHKPDSPAEKARITLAGGFVTEPEWSASARVWLDRECTFPGLAMARSLGDDCVKAVGVIAEPDVAEYRIEAHDCFVVVASDGVWEFLCSDDVVAIVGLNLHKHKGSPHLAERAASEVVTCAIKQWRTHEDGYRDDITCAVFLLPCWGSRAPT
ncbi:phosphatase 2C-like domain-containing protein [Pelagophyceae sp. CCMP2097]|nr:phosphatase 2C-like domain-containing protein [Pelagophyceae sp. CCMP2097]